MDQSFIQKVLDILNANLEDETFGVSELAKTIGLSRSQLHRKLHNIQGISTSQFIREHRLKWALGILITEDITASEAAYRVGFSSATYFSTCFQKFYGYTPGEAKLRNREESFRKEEQESLEITVADRGSSDQGTTDKNLNKKIVVWTGFLLFVLISATYIFYFSDYKESGSHKKGSASTIAKKSIAVLPFKNWTGNPELEYVSDGMTDAVISRLSKVSAIDRVIPFTSIVQYKETTKATEEIATELGVENLLQGNLQISGSEVKIGLRLINGHTNAIIWSNEYTGIWKNDEIFKLQNAVVEGIAYNMNATISKQEMTKIQKQPTNSREAYSNFLRAEFLRNKANEISYVNAKAFYEKAIAIDSNFVEAYIGLAKIWSYGGIVWGIYEEREAWENVKSLLQKALEIEPENEEAKAELYPGYFFYDWDFERTEEAYQGSIINSFVDRTMVVHIDYPKKTGRLEVSLRSAEELILDYPSMGVFFAFKAEALMLLGRADEASELLGHSDKLYIDDWFYLRESAKLHFYLEEYDKSQILLNRLLTHFPDYPPILMWLNAIYAQMDGEERESQKHLDQLKEEYAKGSSGSPAWFIALYYAVIKDNDKTFHWLQKSFDRHEVEMTWLREEPLLAPIRKDPIYIDLYEKVGFTSIGLPIKTASENQIF